MELLDSIYKTIYYTLDKKNYNYNNAINYKIKKAFARSRWLNWFHMDGSIYTLSSICIFSILFSKHLLRSDKSCLACLGEGWRGEGRGGWQRLIQKGNKPCRKKESKENSVNNKPGMSDFNLTFTLFSKPLIWLIPPTKGLGELLTSLSGCVFYWHWLKNINFLLTKRAPWRILAGDCGSMDWVVLCP